MSIFALLFAFLLPGAYEGPVSAAVDRVVARVNSGAVTLSEVDQAVFERKRADPQAKKIPVRDLFKSELIRLVDRELLHQAAVKMNIVTPEEAIGVYVDDAYRKIEETFGSPEAMREGLAKFNLTPGQLKIDLQKREEKEVRVVRAINSRFTLSDEEVDEFAKKRRSEGKPALSYELRHILIACGDDAEEAKKAKERSYKVALEIQSKKSSFASAARANSDDLDTRDDGGYLGYVDEGSLMPLLEDAIKDLDVGEICQPVRSESGYHILKIVDKRTPRKILYGIRFEEERKKWVEELRKDAIIDTMDFEFLQNISEDSSSSQK